MPAAQLTDLDILRARLCGDRELLDGAGYATTGQDATALIAAMLPDGSWPDVEYADEDLKDWAAAAHLSRLRWLARAWYPAQTDAAIHAALLRGLDTWYARDPHNPNWWWNQIGAPLLLGEALLCLKDTCDHSYIDRAVPAFECHQPITRFTGQNLVWTATVGLYHGILTDNPERVSQAFTLIGKEVRVLPGEEGIQPDMSFHQHGNLLYTGGYGQGFAADVARLIAIAAGTAYEWPVFLVDRFARYVLDGCRWMVRGRTFDPGAVGREITRQGHSAARFYSGVRALAGFAHARQPEAQASAMLDPAAGQSLVSGNRHFWCSDLMTQHRPAYYLSVRVPSPRVVNADWPCCGGEGRLCHHMADGATFIMRDGDEYRDLYPVWNWRQVPGVTAVQEAAFDPDALRVAGERPFADGASDGRVGCAAVDFARVGLAAKKAWFLFDEGMVALGAGITCEAHAPVRTTINQCHWRTPAYLAGTDEPLATGTYPLMPGSAFRQDGVTYRILDGGGTLTLGPQSGAWSDCGVGSSERQILNVLNAGLNHGTRPNGASYAYAVLPNAPDNFADDPARFLIVRNDDALQAVWHAGDRRGHVVFYEPGSLTFPDSQRIAVDRPCILLYHPGPATILTVAQPEGGEGLLTVTLTGPISATLGVSLPANEYAGASQTLVWHN